ncbi:alpha/beta hydrolase [Streptomyces sp. NPDC056728]
MTDLFTAPTTTTRTPHATWEPPVTIATRGTLLVLPGRGEHPLVYERFGRRLAADGYLVHVLGTHPENPAGAVRDQASAVAGPEPVAPLVLVGSDTGALQALHAAALSDPSLPVAGVVVAGAAPTTDPDRAVEVNNSESAWDDELAARTACPAHRKRLTDDASFSRGRLTDPVPHHLRADAHPEVPALILHGAADPVTAVEQARGLAGRLPRTTLGVVHDGVHDVLNDASHRTTAATVVLWLERLRADRRDLRPILTVAEADGNSAAGA